MHKFNRVTVWVYLALGAAIALLQSYAVLRDVYRHNLRGAAGEWFIGVVGVAAWLVWTLTAARRSLWWRRRFYTFLTSAGMAVVSFLDEHDKCELCEERPAERVCESCAARICDECESGHYSDVDFCQRCEAALTPEQRAQDAREAQEGNCESCCHRPDCPATLPHSEHTDACRSCNCFETDEPCPGGCKPSGYTEAAVEV